MNNPSVNETADNLNNDNDNNLNTDDLQSPEIENVRYWQDCHQLVSLLPKEVWYHISGFLDNKSFLNLINSSLFFRQLFLQKRVLSLYEPVLEILLPQFEQYFRTQPAVNDTYSSTHSIILNSRAVCKSWKQTLDKKARTLKPELSRSKNPVHLHLSKKYSFHRSGEVEAFLEHFKTTHPSNSNPSPGKRITVVLNLDEPDHSQLSNRISALLEKYGQHIHTFGVITKFGHVNPPEVYYNFVKWLSYMPNLLNLEITYYFPLMGNSIAHISPKIFSSKQLNSLRNLTIETYVSYFSNDPIPSWSWLERYNLSPLCFLCNNLNFLKITLMNNNDVVVFNQVAAPLKTLVVEYFCEKSDINFAEVFSTLSEKFSTTLETLKLSFRGIFDSSGRMKIMRDSFNCRLNLPKLRIFKIRICGMFCLDFLLGMQESLEELTVIYSGGKLGIGSHDYCNFHSDDISEIGLIENKQIIGFLGQQEKMSDSNIWNIIPKLRKICLQPCAGDKLKFERGKKMKMQLYKVCAETIQELLEA